MKKNEKYRFIKEDTKILTKTLIKNRYFIRMSFKYDSLVTNIQSVPELNDQT